MSFPIVSCLVLSSLVPSGFVLDLSCALRVWSCASLFLPILSRLVLSCDDMSFRKVPCLGLYCLVVSCLVLCCLVLSCVTPSLHTICRVTQVTDALEMCASGASVEPGPLHDEEVKEAMVAEAVDAVRKTAVQDMFITVHPRATRFVRLSPQ